MDYPKDPYHQQQHPYPQQPFVGQGVPLGSDQMQYNYPQNQMPPPHNQYPYQQPQNYGMPPPPPPMIAPGNVVIVDTNQIIKTRPTQRGPEIITCRRCNMQGMSRINHEPGNGTWIAVFGLFIFGCWPCCLIPLCMQDCQDCKHYCSSCGEYLGKKKFLIDEDD